MMKKLVLPLSLLTYVHVMPALATTMLDQFKDNAEPSLRKMCAHVGGRVHAFLPSATEPNTFTVQCLDTKAPGAPNLYMTMTRREGEGETVFKVFRYVEAGGGLLTVPKLMSTTSILDQ